MKRLWDSSDCQAWARALAVYPGVVAARDRSRLPELDGWWREELPPVLAARQPPHVTAEELALITEWKMKRGAWRGRNLKLVRQNDPDEVVRVSAAAFARIPDPRAPVTLLAELGGVGPAAASAVLAPVRPDLYPFFDEDVAAQIPGLGPPAFTVAYYLTYAARLRDRAAALEASCPNTRWTANAIGLALWALARPTDEEE